MALLDKVRKTLSNIGQKIDQNPTRTGVQLLPPVSFKKLNIQPVTKAIQSYQARPSNQIAKTIGSAVRPALEATGTFGNLAYQSIFNQPKLNRQMAVDTQKALDASNRALQAAKAAREAGRPDLAAQYTRSMIPQLQAQSNKFTQSAKEAEAKRGALISSGVRTALYTSAAARLPASIGAGAVGAGLNATIGKQTSPDQIARSFGESFKYGGFPNLAVKGGLLARSLAGGAQNLAEDVAYAKLVEGRNLTPREAIISAATPGAFEAISQFSRQVRKSMPKEVVEKVDPSGLMYNKAGQLFDPINGRWAKNTKEARLAAKNTKDFIASGGVPVKAGTRLVKLSDGKWVDESLIDQYKSEIDTPKLSVEPTGKLDTQTLKEYESIKNSEYFSDNKNLAKSLLELENFKDTTTYKALDQLRKDRGIKDVYSEAVAKFTTPEALPTKQVDLKGFGENLDPKNKSRATILLSDKTRIDGGSEVITKAEKIEKLLGQGYKPGLVNGKPVLKNASGNFYEVTKIESDYAQHLLKTDEAPLGASSVAASTLPDNYTKPLSVEPVAQGGEITLYRGSTPERMLKDKGRGVSFATDKGVADRFSKYDFTGFNYEGGKVGEYTLPKSAKILDASTLTPNKIGGILDRDNIIKYAKENGYDAVDLSKQIDPILIKAGYLPEKEIRVLNTKILKPVAQGGVGKVGGEVSSPILSNDPGTRKGIRTGQERVTDLLSKTKLEKPLKGEIPTRTKASQEVSLEPIISKKGKLNIARLATDDIGKQALEDINRELPTSVITNKSVIEKAKTAKGTKALTDEKMQELLAQQLKNRQQVVDLSAKFSKAKADGASEAELGKIMLDLANQSRVAQQGGTFAGRLLQAQNIVADQSASPMQKILALLDNAGVKEEKYLKDAIKVNWDNATEVVQFYRKYVPPKFGEVLDEIRYTNMLSSPLTHIVNVASNVLQSGIVTPVEKTITGLLDAARSSITGSERKYYATAGIDYTKGYLKALPEAWQKAKDIFTQKEISLKPDMEFVPTGVGGPLQTYTFPLRALESMDQFFRTLVKGGVTEELSKAPKKMTLASIAKSAEDQANYRLFRQAFDPKGELGQGVVLQFFDKWNSAISNLRRLPGGKWVLPFLQTPTNILKQGFEYSPLGVTTTIGAKNPIEQLSKAVIGTGVFAAAYQLAQSGLVSWDAPKGQKERELYYAAGMQPYSVKIGDKWVSFSKLGPLSYPLAMAAALGNAERNKPDDSRVKNIADSVGGMLAFFGDQSYVRSIGDLVESIQGGVSVGPNAIAGQAANFAGQLIPYKSFLTWLGRITDPTYRKAQTFTERLKKDLPVVGSQLEPYTTPTGEPSKRDFPMLNAVSPFRVTQEKQPASSKLEQYKETKIKKDRIEKAKEEAKKSGSNIVEDTIVTNEGKSIKLSDLQKPTGTTLKDYLSSGNRDSTIREIYKAYAKGEIDQSTMNKAFSGAGVSVREAENLVIATLPTEQKATLVYDRLVSPQSQLKDLEELVSSKLLTTAVIKEMKDTGKINDQQESALKNYLKQKTGKKTKGKKPKKFKPTKFKAIKLKGAKKTYLKQKKLTLKDLLRK